jgi:hypothetical protein
MVGRNLIIARVLLGIVFVTSALLKLLLSTNAHSPTLFTAWTINPIVRYGIIASELLLAIWLFTPIATKFSLMTCIIVLSMFCGIMIPELTRAKPRSCGCFGSALGDAKRVETASELKRSIAVSLSINTGLMVLAGIAFANDSNELRS